MKCFKCLGHSYYAYECLNKKAMLLRDNGEIESISKHEKDKGESNSSGEESNEGWSKRLKERYLV